MNYDGPAMAQQIMRLQARVKELLDSKQHEFKCFQEVNSELTEVREENARLRKVVDAAREADSEWDESYFKTLSPAEPDAKLRAALRELDAPQKGVTSPSEGVDTEKECSKCRALVKIGPCDEHAAPGC